MALSATLGITSAHPTRPAQPCSTGRSLPHQNKPWAGCGGRFEVSPAQDPGPCFVPYDRVLAGRPQEGAGPVPSAGSGASCCGICTHNTAAASAAGRVGTACSGIAAEVTQCAAAGNGIRAINNEGRKAINSRMQAHNLWLG